MAEPAADKGDAPAAPAAVTMSPSLAESGHVDEAPGAAAGASASAAAADKGAPEAAGAAGDGDDDDSDDDGYVPPEDADIDAVRKAGEGRPEDDDSLKRYKAALLGSGAGAAAGEPLRVVIDELRLEHPADASARHPKPGPTLVVPVPAAGAPADAGAPPLVVKGGAWRRVSISFHVHGQIVFGLKLRMRIKGARSGITLDRMNMMLGSYAPKAEQQHYTAPPTQYPANVFARGGYIAECAFVDDHGHTHLEFTYRFQIGRDWDWSHPAVMA